MHGRKKAAGDMSDNQEVPFHYLVFRCGWLVKNLHTAFDYVFNSKVKDRKCARVLAGWMDKTYGGISPSFKHIKTEKKKAELFMNALLHHHHTLPTRATYILFGSFLRFYDEFLEILSYDPSNKFDDPSMHPFVSQVNSIMEDCEVSEDLFNVWKKEIEEEFGAINYMALPTSDVPSCLIDGRPVADEIADVKKYSAGAYNKCQAMERLIKRQEATIQDLRKKNDMLLEKVQKTEENVKEILALLKGNRGELKRGASPETTLDDETAHVPPKKQLKFAPKYDVVVKTLDQSSPDMFLFHWTVNNATKAYYEHDKKAMTKSEKSKFEQRFHRLKNIATALMKFYDGDVLPAKPDKAQLIFQWKADIKFISQSCYAKGVEAFGKGKNLSKTMFVNCAKIGRCNCMHMFTFVSVFKIYI